MKQIKIGDKTVEVEYDDLQFGVEGCKGCEIDGLRLERVTATGLAVRFAEAA